MTPEISVVIPTYRRPETLAMVLEALELQRGAPPFEVVVVDDGSEDRRTSELLASWKPGYRFRPLAQKNGGPASARNRGVSESEGAIVLFLGDDTVPEPRLLAVHAAAHGGQNGKIAVLGYTTWPQERKVSPFLHHINEYGLQFGYGLIEDPEAVPFNFFYTSNISLSRRLLLDAGLFDTTFPHAAWEDIEIAWRLTRDGLRILYRPEAVARHHHDITFSSFRRRQEKSGEAAAIFQAKHPELAEFLGVPQALSGARTPPLLTEALARWASLAQRWELPGGRRAIDRVLKEDYLRGLRRALNGGQRAG
jgi:glycosyltransferase involved in cell wall biosynthesis